MTRNKNHDDVAPWSDLAHDVLFIVMMQLGVVEFLAFSGVCKSWRSFALSNRNTFMASMTPMSIDINLCANNQDSYCSMEDFVGRRFRTIIPHSAGRICIGVTCGYLVLFGKKTRDFWLVNPIKRHELHFPRYPYCVGVGIYTGAILVFSPSISDWMLVIHRHTAHLKCPTISFCIAGKQGWNHVFSALPILDILAFKGKIYTLHTGCSLCELRLHPNRRHKWMLLETNNFPKPDLLHKVLVSSAENIYLLDRCSMNPKVMELDFGEMKWILAEKTVGEYIFFLSWYKPSAAIKPNSWADPRLPLKSYDLRLRSLDIDKTHKSRRNNVCCKQMWYFPHDCLNVNILDES